VIIDRNNMTSREDSREIVFVTGHRNPDMDSVCSSLCYARLKNILDPTRRYIPIRGHLNDITKAQFDRLGIDAPIYACDIRPRIADICQRMPVILDAEDPLIRLCNIFKTQEVSSVVVFRDRKYSGVLAVSDITKYLLNVLSISRPSFPFSIKNFPKVLKGRFIQEGAEVTFETTILIAMMKFDRFQNHLLDLKHHLPLVITSALPKHLRFAVEMNVPCIVLTGVDRIEPIMPLFAGYKGTIYLSEVRTDEALQLLRMSISLKHLLPAEQPQAVSPQDYFDDVKDALMRSEFGIFPVMSGEKFKGVVGRRDFVQRPRKKVILMDHNELNQSIEGLEDADVIEIIDHHRFAPQKTHLPIFIDCEPVGSTCTLVYGLYRRHDVDLDAETAACLLSGLISDTVILKSPTTTDTDREVAHKLARIAKVKDLKHFGETLFSGGASITTQDPRKLICADFKCFNECGVQFGIGQCEVTTFEGVDEVKVRWLDVLERVKKENKLEWAMVVITNIIREDSIMLCTRHLAESKLSYKKDSDGQYDCPGVLSRKIQVLPEVIRVLGEEL
jgi:manganese-dependent inorganic pyrophosphatase